jgi:hypothetical protein
MWDWLKVITLRTFWNKVSDAASSEDPAAADEIRQRAAAMAPIIWLLGKTGAGKTSIVAAITGDSRAEVGNGFRPCTRQSRIYDWPADAPILRFLDTRGVGEAGYEPAEDIAFAEGKAQLARPRRTDHRWICRIIGVKRLSQSGGLRANWGFLRARRPAENIGRGQTGGGRGPAS